MKSFHDGKVILHAGDCMEVLRTIPADSIDAVVTDPPYALVSIVKRFGGKNAAPVKPGSVYARSSVGFMGSSWDTGEVAFNPEFWAEVLRVAKPGAHLVAFSGCRTYHRMACAIEDGGWDIREMLAWVFSQGFPKSHSMRDIGRPELGTAIKPAFNPICLARAPLSEGTVAANVLRWGTGALNIDATRIQTGENLNGGAYAKNGTERHDGAENWRYKREGDAGEYKQPLGRWPANLCHDGSPEVMAGFPETASGTLTPDMNISASTGWSGGSYSNRVKSEFHGNSGSAARYFYTSKADADDRLASKHPTVKPVDLMQWLVRLVCPKGATVLDPFAGTGTTGAATFIEGRRCVLIEREAEYLADIERRMGMLLSGQDERARKLATPDPHDTLPLFAVMP